MLTKKLETKRQHKKEQTEETWKHGFTIWKIKISNKPNIEEETWYVLFGSADNELNIYIYIYSIQ